MYRLFFVNRGNESAGLDLHELPQGLTALPQGLPALPQGLPELPQRLPELRAASSRTAAASSRTTAASSRTAAASSRTAAASSRSGTEKFAHAAPLLRIAAQAWRRVGWNPTQSATDPLATAMWY